MGYVYWIFHSAKITVLAYVRSSKGFRIFLLFIVMYFLCSPPSLDGFLVCLVSVSGVEQTGIFCFNTFFFFFLHYPSQILIYVFLTSSRNYSLQNLQITLKLS